MTDATPPAAPGETPAPADPPAPDETPAASAPHHTKRRPGLVWTLIILAALIGFVGTLTTWVNRQMLDNQSWSKSSARLLQDPEIRSALSVYLVNQLYDNVDVSGELQKKLPPDLSGLAAPIAASLREPATKAVDQLLGRPRVQALWVQANETAHAKFVAVVEDKTIPGISTANGTVTLDVTELLKSLAQELGLPATALDRLPEGAGQITILKSDQLSAAQHGVRLIKTLSVWLLVLVFVLWAGALYFAAGARRVALRNIGWSIFVVGALLLVVRHSLGNYIVHALTKDPARLAGHHVWLITTGILGDMGWAGVSYGLAVVIGTIIAGPTRAGTAIRRWIAPMLNERPWVAAAIVAFAYILVIAWGPTHALRVPFGIALLAVLVALGVYVLRRETLQEFPPGAEPAVAAAGGGGMAWPKRSKGDGSVAAEIERLDGLRASGAITDEEYTRAKEKALS